MKFSIKKLYTNLIFYIRKKFLKKVVIRIFFFYAFLLLTATLFLSTPWVRNDGSFVLLNFDGFINSFFTAVSAFTTTGLQVLDTETDFNFGGQLIILILIFFGAIGLLFFKVQIFIFFRFLFFRSEKTKIMDAYEQHFERGHFNIQNTKKMLRVGFFVIFSIEIIGAIAIFFYLFYKPIAGVSYHKDGLKSFWTAIFLSISATSNAGFDNLKDATPFNSLTIFTDHYFLQIVIILQFLLGGLGFPIYLELWERIRTKNKIKKKFTFFAKLIFYFYILAIFITLSIVFIFEATLDKTTVKDGDWTMKVIFNTLSARSSGFSTVDIKEHFTAPSKYVLALLMWIGCSPLSTGGGIKITTFVIAFLAIFSKNDAKGNFVFFRSKITISSNSIISANKIIFASLVLIFLSSLTSITDIDENPSSLSLFDAIFHSTSAFGNAGLTTIKIKSEGWYFFKIFTIILMLVGQIGLINIITYKKKDTLSKNYSLPKKILF